MWHRCTIVYLPLLLLSLSLSLSLFASFLLLLLLRHYFHHHFLSTFWTDSKYSLELVLCNIAVTESDVLFICKRVQPLSFPLFFLFPYIMGELVSSDPMVLYNVFVFFVLYIEYRIGLVTLMVFPLSLFSIFFSFSLVCYALSLSLSLSLVSAMLWPPKGNVSSFFLYLQNLSLQFIQWHVGFFFPSL